jgi:hypothetical protein
MIRIPRVCATITVDFMKEYMSQFGTIESVVRTENGFENEVQYEVAFRYWNEIGEMHVQQVLDREGSVRLCYEDEGPRPFFFLCYKV